MNNNRLVLIDGHAILHRAYHAYPAKLLPVKGPTASTHRRVVTGLRLTEVNCD